MNHVEKLFGRRIVKLNRSKSGSSQTPSTSLSSKSQMADSSSNFSMRSRKRSLDEVRAIPSAVEAKRDIIEVEAPDTPDYEPRESPESANEGNISNIIQKISSPFSELTNEPLTAVKETPTKPRPARVARRLF